MNCARFCWWAGILTAVQGYFLNLRRKRRAKRIDLAWQERASAVHDANSCRGHVVPCGGGLDWIQTLTRGQIETRSRFCSMSIRCAGTTGNDMDDLGMVHDFVGARSIANLAKFQWDLQTLTKEFPRGKFVGAAAAAGARLTCLNDFSSLDSPP